MKSIKIFISSVQKEFARERRLVCDYIRQDALLGRFFEPFLFEELPAKNQSVQEACLSEVGRCDTYVGILGNEYGYEDSDGVSPTEREYDHATEKSKHRLVFTRKDSSGKRHVKQACFITKAEAAVIRKSFVDYEELRKPHTSVPVNPLMANPMYLTGYIKQMGTGTGDIIRKCTQAGLKPPAFIQEEEFKVIIWRNGDQVSDSVNKNILKIVRLLAKPRKSAELQEMLKLKHKTNFRKNYLDIAIKGGYIALSHEDTPNHPDQSYCLTAKGVALYNKIK